MQEVDMVPRKSEPITGSLVKPLHVVFDASPNFAEILQQVQSSLLDLDVSGRAARRGRSGAGAPGSLVP